MGGSQIPELLPQTKCKRLHASALIYINRCISFCDLEVTKMRDCFYNPMLRNRVEFTNDGLGFKYAKYGAFCNLLII